jgi:hypothetical protein
VNETVELRSLVVVPESARCQDCGENGTHVNHSSRNHSGHYFNGEPHAMIADRNDLKRRTKPTPPPLEEDARKCRNCRRTRVAGRHRGRGSHPYDPPADPRLAAIAKALARVLRASGARVTVVKNDVDPTYGPGRVVSEASVQFVARVEFRRGR